MNAKDYAAANNFINWLVMIIQKISDFIKGLLGKADPTEPAS